MLKCEIIIALGFLILWQSSAIASFSSSKRSINGTGETLNEGEFELGISSLHYGVDDSWLLTTPSLMTFVGYGRAELRRKFKWNEQRISPYVAARTPRIYSLGSDYGLDFGEDKSQSLTIGGRVDFRPRVHSATHGPRSKLHTQFLPNVEYDYYLNGDLVYVGIAEYRAYLGYTWAFKNWHLGLITGPANNFIPLPYVYLRF